MRHRRVTHVVHLPERSTGMSTPSSSCQHCGTSLPAGTDARRRYCSPACRTAAYRSRRTGQVESPAVARVRELEALVSSLSTENGQLRGRVRDRDERIHRLAGQLAAEQRTADRAIRGQAGRTVAVRDRLADRTRELSAVSADRDRVATELSETADTLATLRRSWTLHAGRTPDSQEVATLRRTLAGVRADRDTLARRYDELSAAADSYLAERRQLQGIVRQWDRLCRRLDKATGGRPRTEADRNTLGTWRAFRRAVSGQQATAGRTGGAR